MENIFYVNYNQHVEISFDALIVAMWNEYSDHIGGDKKISLNNKEFFNNSFDNQYDAAWAVSLSGQWSWTDDYVCFDDDGYLASFSHWNDANSPIDIDKLDLSHLIDGLDRWDKKQQKGSISIHDALK